MTCALACAFGAADGRQQATELSRSDPFDQVMIESGFCSPAAIVLAPPAAQGDDRRPDHQGKGPNMATNIDAAHLREAEIAQDHLGLRRLQ